MTRVIPGPLLSTIANAAAGQETQASLDSLFIYAEAFGDPPLGSKQTKALEWLRVTNKIHSDPMAVAGKIIENYMENPHTEYSEVREKINTVLVSQGLQYVTGGHIVPLAGLPSISLEQHLRQHHLDVMTEEFNRALKNVDVSPREAASAASNILETLFKVYIEDEGLAKPVKQDMKSLWAIVRNHMGFDPSILEDQDLQKVLTGLASIVDGIGSFRTHASSAHGAGRKYYKLEPRHARLVINSSHTFAHFILESWAKKKAK
jgi:hypothetical protein